MPARDESRRVQNAHGASTGRGWVVGAMMSCQACDPSVDRVMPEHSPGIVSGQLYTADIILILLTEKIDKKNVCHYIV